MGMRARRARKSFRYRFRQRVELLEDRRMLSVTMDVASRAAVPSASAAGDSVVYRDSVSQDGRYIAFLSDASNLVSGPAIVAGVNNLYRADRLTGEVVLVSVNVAGNTAANANVVSATISADGNVIAFLSAATNLSPLDSDSHFDVYVRNVSAGTTTLASISSNGTGSANQNCDFPCISADGTTVAFQSPANNLDARDMNGFDDIFARNLLTGTMFLVSTNLSGTQSANAGSRYPTISGDGRVIAFTSSATDLVVNDNNSAADIFARDLSTGTTTLVSVNSSGTGSANGQSEYSAISEDGNLVTFGSTASNLHPSDPTTDLDVYARNIATGTTYLVSDSVPTNASAFWPSISADGNVVVFNGMHDVYARDLITGITRLVSVNSSGTGGGNLDSQFMSISTDGNIITFWSNSSNIDPLQTGAKSSGKYHSFVRDVSTGVTRLLDSYAFGNGTRMSAIASANGSVIAYTTGNGDIASGDLNQSSDVFALDLADGNAQLLSKHVAGFESVTAHGESNFDHRTMSADGRFVIFASAAINLVTGVQYYPEIWNLYRYDRVTGQCELVTVSADGTAGSNAGLGEYSISADGNVIAFRSNATNLSDLDHDMVADIFVRNMSTHTTALVSVSAGGGSGGYYSSRQPVVSADGTAVAFTSTSPYLDPLDKNTSADVFVRNLVTGTTKLVSVNAAGTGSGMGVSNSPAISADGHVVAFWSEARNLHPLDTNSLGDTYARDITNNTTYLVSINMAGTASANNGSGSPYLSADGNIVAFSSRSTDLSALDPNSGRDIFARNIAAGTTQLVTVNAAGTAGTNADIADILLSADGNVVAFTSDSADLHPLDSPETEVGSYADAFARNLSTGVTYLLSVNAAGTAGGNGEGSGVGALSADGTKIVFGSRSNDLVAADTNNHLDVFLRDIAAGTTELVSLGLGGSGGGNGDSFSVAISADGNDIVFSSEATDLVERDGNSQTDVFVAVVSSTAPQLPGDFNLDGAVDSGDYLAWRKTSGTVVAPYAGADGSGNGIVGPEDYGVWRAHFGERLAEVVSAPAILEEVGLARSDAASVVITSRVGVPDVGFVDNAAPVRRVRLLDWSEGLGDVPRTSVLLTTALKGRNEDTRRAVADQFDTRAPLEDKSAEGVEQAFAEVGNWKLQRPMQLRDLIT